MRIVAWNVNGRTAAWAWIEETVVDIALLNEAHPAEGRRGLWAREPVHVSKGWRSAVVTDLWASSTEIGTFAGVSKPRNEDACQVPLRRP